MEYTFGMMGRPSETMRFVVTNVAQQLDPVWITRNGQPAIALTVSCEVHDIRFSIGENDPTQGALAEGHILYVGQSMRIANGSAIRNFSYINAVDGPSAIIQVTPEFEIGA